MENIKEEKKRIVSLIESYMSKEIDYDSFFENTYKSELIGSDDIASQAIHLIGHYESDLDIMAKDPAHKEYMDKEVMDCLVELKDKSQ